VVDLPGSAGLSLRKLRVVLALDAVQGGRARLVDRSSGTLGAISQGLLARRQPSRAVARTRATRNNAWTTGNDEGWDAIFPLVEPPSNEDDYGLILLDSNASSHIALTNAIGVVNPSQLRVLKLILAKFSP
jgi:hypothetical protein